MKDNIEEKELDSYIEKMEKKEIKVPKELEAKILETINQVEIKEKPFIRQFSYRILATIAIILTLFTASVKWVPGFAAYASDIPVIKYAVELLQGDSGTELAKKEGYSELNPVTVEQNGFRLVIDNIMFDEDRLVMSLHVYGDEIKKHLKRETTEAIKVGEEPNFAPEPQISLKFEDFKEFGYIAQNSDPSDSDKEALEVRIEKSFYDNEVGAFLANNPGYLTLSAEIILRDRDNDPKVLQTFENIKIPVDPKKIKRSKKYEIKQIVLVDKTKIIVDRLIISPTRMRVDVSFELADGYFFTGFENPYIKDSKGNIYKPEGLVSRHDSETTRSLFFVPSLYFDESHAQLYFGFDGIRIGAEEGKTFSVSLTDSYPKTLTYMGEEIIIEKVSYTNNRDIDPLQIQLQLPRVLSIQGLEIEGSKGRSHGKPTGLDDKGNPYPDLCGVDVDYRPEYEVEFSYPGYLLGGKKEIPIELQ